MKQSLNNLFTRPPRQAYFTYDLGPLLMINNGNRVFRRDFYLNNSKGHKLTVSFYEIEHAFIESCVIYLHTHHGSKLEGVPLVEPLLKVRVNVCLFDFAGYGNSEGDSVSLGCEEIKDLKLVMQYLSDVYNQSDFIFWGRSMGAVCGLLYLSQAINMPNIAGAIFDSPFYSLEKLSLELCQKASGIPEMLLQPLGYFIKHHLKDKISFDKLELLQKVQNIKIPGLFLASKDDQFIKYEHSELLYKNYSGHKQFGYLTTDHNQARKPQDLQVAFDFIQSIVQNFPRRCMKVLNRQLETIINNKNHEQIINSYLYEDSNQNISYF